MSIEDKKCPLNKRRKKNRFSRAFRRLFGCASKNVEGTEHKFISVSCQCQIEKDLEPVNSSEENHLSTETKEQLDKNEYSPVSEEFRTSLKKLDSLIDTLNNIHDVYKSSNPLQCYNDEIKDGIHPDKEDVTNGELEEEVLKFNINFDKNTCIECQTNMGKHSLKIIHKSTHQNFSPLILHRCESEFLLKKRSYENLSLKASSEIFLEKTDQIQRSYYANRLRGKFGGSVYNLSTIKKNVVDQLKNIKNDVKTLRNILYYVECVTSRDRYFLPLSFGEIGRWFLGRSTTMRYDDDNYKRACRYIEAKTRATNFCRFYTMEKKNKEKKKMKKVNKSKY